MEQYAKESARLAGTTPTARFESCSLVLRLAGDNIVLHEGLEVRANF